MKFSEQWLREWVSPNLSTSDLAHQITMAGLEVDAIEPVAGTFSGLLVAEIVAVEPHPDADKLKVCQVLAGSKTVQVVCGAPNARKGLKAPLATVGARLPGGMEIKSAKLRGIASTGMLCAEEELGLSEASDGLMELPADAPVGENLRDYLGLDDQIIEIGLTPNRADCLGMAGIAREVALLNDLSVTPPVFSAADTAIQDELPVRLEASESCPRYVGRVIRDVDVSRPTPTWMQERLRRGGVRSIDAVVDVTNYVLLELGQPMHAFDLGKLNGGIVVRLAEQGESLALLDGQTVNLRADTLVIADESGPLAMAGIMGGQSSAVSAETRDLFLESAFFAPQLLAGKPRSYGLHTDSSHRFERGVDFTLQRTAMERATQLLIDIVGGQAGPVIEMVEDSDLPPRPDVTLRAARIEKVLGFDMAGAEVERILAGLGLGVTATNDGWLCAIPSWRFDISLEVDLLEELARVYGYNNLPVTRIRADLALPSRPESQLSVRGVRRHLGARDYREAITYSFIEPALQNRFDPEQAPVALSNPISTDMAVMRTNLVPGLLSAVLHNINRQQSRVRMYETGLRFLPSSRALEQVPTLAMILTGEREPIGWSSPVRGSDFFDLKGDVESLLALTGRAAEFEFTAAALPGLHPGQTAHIIRDGEVVGFIGAIHPSVGTEMGFDVPVYTCQLDLAAVLDSGVPEFQELSKFPEVRRDISFVIDKSTAVQPLLDEVRSAAGVYLKDLRLFDVYTGKGIDPKRKSLSLGLTFRDQSRTLGDEDVNQAVGQVIDLLEKNYKAVLRK
ncbi:MAG: phenylalanine--tRNA ligase subunit beta [Halieaceae bacterium]|nr:phenylalanine--tRNA ligase subunit beta [Halieaceae bacterium]